MAMTTAGKVALTLTIIVTIVGMILTMTYPDVDIAYCIFEAACILTVGAMGLGGIGCKNRCLMMTYIVFAIIGIVIYVLYGIGFAANLAEYDNDHTGNEDEGWQHRKDKRMINSVAWLAFLFINQILTGVTVFFYFKARREITAEMYNEFYAQNNVVSPVAYSPYPQYGYPAPVYPGQAYPAPYYYQ